MIIVIEGISAAGKTTWCRAHGSGHHVPENGPPIGLPGPDAGTGAIAEYWAERNVHRWRAARAMEDRTGVAVCDTDPLKLHYTWGLWQIGATDEANWLAAVTATRRTMVDQRIGFADAYFVQPIDPARANAQAAGDPTRRRAKLSLHVQLQPSLMAWYRALDRALPGRVSFTWPDSLPQVPPRDRHPGVDAFDRLIAFLAD